MSAVKPKQIVAAAGILGLAVSLAGCFPDGTWLIGSKPGTVGPGLYTSTIPLGGNCQFVIAVPNTTNQFTQTSNGGRSFVQIPASQAGDIISSKGCGLWVTPRATSYNPDRATAKYGEYRVPTDLLTGTYVAPAPQGCSWQLLSSFDTSNAGAILSSGSQTPGHQARVTITSADKGFSSTNCGGWHRVGP